MRESVRTYKLLVVHRFILLLRRIYYYGISELLFLLFLLSKQTGPSSIYEYVRTNYAGHKWTCIPEVQLQELVMLW